MTASTQSPPAASTEAPTSAALRDCEATMPPLETVAGLRICWALENWSRIGVCLVVFHHDGVRVGVVRQEWHIAGSRYQRKESKMAGVKQARDGAVGRLDAERAGQPERHDAGPARRPRRRDRRDDGRRRRAGAGADRGGPRVLLGPEPQGLGGARQRHRRRRHAFLLAGIPGAARMPGADRGRGQRRCGRRRLQPGDGRRHHRRGAFGELHPGVQPDRPRARSRLDLAAAAPDRPPARARTDAAERAALRRACAGMGTGAAGRR